MKGLRVNFTNKRYTIFERDGMQSKEYISKSEYIIYWWTMEIIFYACNLKNFQNEKSWKMKVDYVNKGETKLGSVILRKLFHEIISLRHGCTFDISESWYIKSLCNVLLLYYHIIRWHATFIQTLHRITDSAILEVSLYVCVFVCVFYIGFCNQFYRYRLVCFSHATCSSG